MAAKINLSKRLPIWKMRGCSNHIVSDVSTRLKCVWLGKELIAAGYHMFEMREYGWWYGYKCCKQPYYNGGREVADFDERWT